MCVCVWDCCVWHLILSQGPYLFLSRHETAALLRKARRREHVSPLPESSYGCISVCPPTTPGGRASEHLCAKPPNSRPATVKFAFSVYLACLRHSTTRRFTKMLSCSRFGKALRPFQNNDSDHRAQSLTGEKTSVNHQTRVHRADLKQAITLSFFILQLLSRLIGRTRIGI